MWGKVYIMKLGKLHRSFSVKDAAINAESRTIEFSFSSETPVDRYFGSEVLSHDPQAANFARLQDGANLLWNHDTDQVLGVIEGAEIRDRKGYVKARFSQSDEAQKKFQEITDGILRNVSFGYRVLEMERTKSGEMGDEFTATKWEPYEVSIVSVPADASVGIGRAESNEDLEVRIIDKNQGEKVMEPKIETSTVDTAKIQHDAVQSERSRIAAISNLGERFSQTDMARQLIEGGKSLEQAREAFLEKMEGSQKPVAPATIGLTEKEKNNYSLARAITAQITGDWRKAGFERAASEAIAKSMGRETVGFFMPTDVKMDGTRAAYAAGAPTTGGNIVATNLLADSFIDLLRNKMLVMEMGAKVLSGLVGNIAIPKQSTAAAAYWVTEAATVTESEGTFGQVLMNPKTVGARSQVSRQLLMQGTPDIEMLVRNDLAAVIALAIDAAAISGTGSSGQPTGILNTAGIGSYAMGTNGAALTNIDPMIELETLVATANADFGSLGYLTNPGQVGKLKKLKSTTGEYLWNGAVQAGQSAVPGEVNGYKVGRSAQVTSTLTKGTASGICSAMIFGNFSDLIIGQWGPGVEILANPFGAGFNSGSVDLRALASIDVAVRNAVSFAAITDLL